ncbi:IS1182 family transposase [bacterium]|nr:MAG: IS1182 family transposase [bacterium]
MVNVDRDTPMLLPVDLRAWVPENDLVHFVITAVDAMPLSAFSLNRHGSGSEQYPPHMMLALLIYCYANGVFSSRRIERSTYRDIGVRYLTGDTHPDHDTLCAFRRQNATAVAEAFFQVLQLAREMGLLKVGTVSVDGTHLKANASKHKSLRYDRACALERQLREDIAELLAQAEQQDRQEQSDGQSLPEEIGRRERLREKMAEARRRLEERARAEASEAQDGPPDEQRPPPADGTRGKPKGVPEASKQINLTDADSALMRKSKRSSYEQAYNAQAVVDAGGSQLILATAVLSSPSDANQLEPACEAVPPGIGTVERVLADGGYVNAKMIEAIGQRGIEVYVAISDEEQNVRRYDYRPPKEKKPRVVTDPTLVAMREKLRTEEGRRIYAKRASTVEPVFGIIKASMGFRQFLLRGLAKVRLEWDLVCLAYNIRRIHSLVSA